MTKVLFLDWDGVLTSAASYDFTHRVDPIQQDNAAHLDYLIQMTGCKIVISSVKRNNPLSVQKLLYAFGYENFHEDYATPYISTNSKTRRGEEIKQWLEAHPDITNYAIIDDDSDFLHYQKPRFVRTDTMIGMTRIHADYLIKLLGELEEPLVDIRPRFGGD